jgi:putative ABC transport system ATP-binding protein
VASDAHAVECRAVVKTYWTETSEVRALNGISADFARGAITAVVGPSGSGKSSLLRIIAGLDRPTSGHVRLGSVEVSSLSPRELRRVLRNMVGFVFQSPADNFVSYLTVMEHLELAGRRRRATRTDALALLTQLGIAERAAHLPHELSGGEQQRAAFAQVLMSGASLVVADEPTAELDDDTAADLLDAVRALTSEGVTFVLSTHDPHVAEVARDVIVLEHGHVAGARPPGGGESP